MDSIHITQQRHAFLAMALATRRERTIALTIAAVALLLFLASVPFVRIPLARIPAFIPAYEAALIFIDLVTAVLLFDQAVRLRSIGILALAAGYLFDALIIVPHALSFPGAFSSTGLLGAKEQTTAWLYIFWHGGFPLFVLMYAILRRHETNRTPPGSMGWIIVLSVLGVVALTTTLTLLATWGHDLLPVVMQGSDYSLLVSKGISPAVWLLTLVAMIGLWSRKLRVVDLWLMLVMWIWLLDIALAAMIGSTRFDLGFYSGRLFGLIGASFLLITLLIEMARMHAGALGAAASAERKLAEFARRQSRSEMAPLNAESTQAFISRHNIERYEHLLETTTDQAERQRILTLLTEERQKHQDAEDKPIGKRTQAPSPRP